MGHLRKPKHESARTLDSKIDRSRARSIKKGEEGQQSWFGARRLQTQTAPAWGLGLSGVPAARSGPACDWKGNVDRIVSMLDRSIRLGGKSAHLRERAKSSVDLERACLTYSTSAAGSRQAARDDVETTDRWKSNARC